MEKNLDKNLSKLFPDKFLNNFWLFNSLGWIIYLTIHLPSAMTYFGTESYKVTLSMMHVLFGFGLSFLLRLIYKKIRLKNLSVLSFAFKIILISFIATMVWYRLDDLLRVMFVGWEKGIKNATFWHMILEVIWNTPIMLAWSFFYFSISFYREFEVQKERAAKAYAIVAETQLEMLRYQLNPHFIFNTLSSLRALVKRDPEKAKNMITKMAEFLRYALVENSDKKVPLLEELEVIQSYLEIEKVRFENNLTVIFKIDPRAEKFPVPNFIIHPLIDNAIKHGISVENPKIQIEITATVNDMNLVISVINNGKIRKYNSFDRKEDTKTGLQNIRKRLQFLYPENHTFSLIEKEGFVIASIQINQNNDDKKNH